MIYYNAKIIRVTQETINNGYIKSKDGKIVDIGDAKHLRSLGDESYDLKGAWVYPGFIDAHCHMGMRGELSGSINDVNAAGSFDPFNNFKSIYAIDVYERIFKEAANAGITTCVVSPGSEYPIAGDVVALKTRGKSIDEMMIKNPVGVKFALGENPKYSHKGGRSRMETVALIRDGLLKVKLGENSRAKNAETLLKLLNREIKAFVHCHKASDIQSAVRIAKEFNLDLVLLHATESRFIKDDLKRQKIILGPLFTDISKQELKHLDIRTAAILEREKINFAVCSDYPEFLPQHLLLSLGVAIREGLTRREALKSITINAAEICGISDRVGSLELYKDCDFVVYDKGEDIFNVYAKPKLVVIKSKIIDK